MQISPVMTSYTQPNFDQIWWNEISQPICIRNVWFLGLISATLSCPVYVPPRKEAAVPSREEHGLLSRTAASNRASLILCSKILLNVLHNMSLTAWLQWQHTGFQTSETGFQTWLALTKRHVGSWNKIAMFLTKARMHRGTGTPKILESRNWLFQGSVSWRWPKDTWALGTRLESAGVLVGTTEHARKNWLAKHARAPYISTQSPRAYYTRMRLVLFCSNYGTFNFAKISRVMWPAFII